MVLLASGTWGAKMAGTEGNTSGNRLWWRPTDPFMAIEIGTAHSWLPDLGLAARDMRAVGAETTTGPSTTVKAGTAAIIGFFMFVIVPMWGSLAQHDAGLAWPM